MIKFAHIAPTEYLGDFASSNDCHLVLAHLVESDDDYWRFYSCIGDRKYKIMDNSAFEMFKQGRPMYDSSKLIEMAKRCKADCIVMSDYPREPWHKTMQAAANSMEQIKAAGFDTFFVPQSELGDLAGFMVGLSWAINEPNIDIIGLSILGCPIALGIDEKLSQDQRKDAYRLQRFMSRWKIFREMEKRGLLDLPRAQKKFHCLGMVDGPNEIELLNPYHKYIRSWDSSAAIWCGLHGKTFDNSPTGLIDGKFEKEVDFSCVIEDYSWSDVMANISYINKLTRGNDKHDF